MVDHKMLDDKDARVWLRENRHEDIADLIDEIMVEWKNAGKNTRRNWWDILAGDKDGNPRIVAGRKFPVLKEAQIRQSHRGDVVFATSNSGKVHSMRKWLKNYDITVVKYPNTKDIEEFKEPQEGTLEEIAREKALYFKKRFPRPLVVQDSGFFIKAVGGFPGRYVKSTLKDLGINGLLNLKPVVEGDRDCFFRDVLAFWSQTYEKYHKKNKRSTDYYPAKIFVTEVHGKLAIKPSKVRRNEMWSELWTIFIPEGFEVTLAEMDEAEQEKFASQIRLRPECNCFIQFAEWISSNKIYLYPQPELEFEDINSHA